MASRSMKDRLEAAAKIADEALAAAAGTPPETPAPEGGNDGNPADPNQNNVDWEHKYKVLEGKYKAEVPKLHSAVQEQAAKIAELTVQVGQRSTLEDEGATVIDFTDEKTLTPKLKEFKDEYPDVFDGIVETIKVAGVKQPKKKDPPPAEQTQAHPANPETPKETVWTKSMYQLLDTKVPDWREINKDNGFLEWLSEKDIYSNKTKQQLLLDAYAAGDVETVSNVFIGYTVQKAPAPDNEDPDNLAPPRTTSGSIDSSQAQPETITRAFIAKFFKDVALGKYKGREKDMNAINARIDKAVASRAVQ